MASINPQAFKTRSGEPFVIRSAQVADAAALLAYIRPVAEETEFFVLEPDEFPTEELEQRWIQEHLDHHGRLVLLAEISAKIVGSLSFENGPYRRVAHRGSLGISVCRQWRRQGVGTALLSCLLAWAKDNLIIEKVCLEVFTTNLAAIQLYKKLGFIEQGVAPRDIKRGPGQYVDVLSMYRFVNPL